MSMISTTFQRNGFFEKSIVRWYLLGHHKILLQDMPYFSKLETDQFLDTLPYLTDIIRMASLSKMIGLLSFEMLASSMYKPLSKIWKLTRLLCEAGS